MQASDSMRLAIPALLAIHGAIHLLGFLKPWKLARVEQLSGRTLVPLSETASRAMGLLWLAAALLLVTAAAFRAAERGPWWMPAALGVALSQALILFQWSDAKAGTLANLLLVLPIAMGAATARFDRESDALARALLARAPVGSAPLVTAADLVSLPPPVRRWLQASGAVGKPRARTVRLRQRGELRTGPDQPFLPAAARQYFTVDEPGFVWMVEVTMFGVVPVVGRDSYLDGRGRMLIRAGGLVTIADGRGDKVDQGALLRYLGEIVWFPSAALAPYLAWEEVDAQRARATMSHGGVEASAVFEFDDRDRLAQLQAKRYFGDRDLQDWVVRVTEWREIRGLEMPVRGSAIWKLDQGDFEYYRWEIEDVEADRRELW